MEARLLGREDRALEHRHQGRVVAAADINPYIALAAAIGDAKARWGRIDILHNNVGVSIAGGDAVLGPASVVEAIAGGEKAAAGIDRMFTGENHAFWRVAKEVDTFFDPDAEPVAYGRSKM